MTIKGILAFKKAMLKFFRVLPAPAGVVFLIMVFTLRAESLNLFSFPRSSGWSVLGQHQLLHSLHYTGRWSADHQVGAVYEAELPWSFFLNDKMKNKYSIEAVWGARQALRKYAADPDLYGIKDLELSVRYPLAGVFDGFFGTVLPLSALSKKRHIYFALNAGLSFEKKKELLFIRYLVLASRYFYRYISSSKFHNDKFLLGQVIEGAVDMNIFSIRGVVFLYSFYDYLGAIRHEQNFEIRFERNFGQIKTQVFAVYSWRKRERAGYTSMLPQLDTGAVGWRGGAAWSF